MSVAYEGLNDCVIYDFETLGTNHAESAVVSLAALVFDSSHFKEGYTYDELLRWRKANWVLTIPVFAVKLLYYLGKFINSTFLKENTVKLISDNIFPSEKICSHIDLSATINDVQLKHKENS